MDNPELSFSDIIRIKWKYRKVLIFVFFVSAVLCAGISLLLPNEYKAVATIFPARTSELVINDYGIRRGNISQFGEIEEAEEFLELIGSPQFQLRIIDMLDLATHYEIDSSEKMARTKALEAYNNQVSSRRTKYNAVEIAVMDEDPQMAAKISSTIVDEIDHYRAELIQARAKESLSFFIDKKQELEDKNNDIVSRITDLNSRGVVSKIERAGLYESQTNGGSSRVKSQIDSNLKYGAKYDVLENENRRLMDRLAFLDKAEDQLKSQTEGAVSYKFDVQRPLVPEKKAKPKRSILTLLGAFGATAFALVYLILKEKWPDLKAILN